MGELLALVAAAALIAIAVWIQGRRSRDWCDVLESVTALHDGLTIQGRGDDGRAEGTVDGLPLAVDTALALPGQLSSLQTRVTVETSLPRDVAVTREGVGASLSKLVGGDDITVGDPAFDAAVRVRGVDPAAVVARLDAAARRAVLTLFDAHDATVERGCVTAFCTGYASPSALQAMIVDAAALGRALEDTRGAVAERLERIALGDPVAGVRHHAFELLVASLAPSEVAAFAERALAHEDLHLVARAATLLRDEAAITTLLGRLGRAEVDAGPAGALAEAVSLLAEVGRPPSLEVLTRLLDREEREVQLAAAEALGRCGDVSCVEPLRERARGPRASGDLKRAVHEAVAAIQARSGADPGRLSVVDGGEEGALALAPEEAEDEAVEDAEDPAVEEA